MCGIAGIIGQMDQPKEKISRMAQTLKHRGPDSTGIFVNNNIALAHNRLSIIDLNDISNQPFFDNSRRYSLVYNGEIYNYLELRKELEPHFDFQTESDTEVLLYSYLHWKEKSLDKFTGMFSFAIWDDTDKTLFAARDRFGVKPFYYLNEADIFTFASEIKAIKSFKGTLSPDLKAISAFLKFGSYGSIDSCFYNDIKQLPGGHYLHYKDGSVTTKKWYSFKKNVSEISITKSDEDLIEEYENLMYTSIGLRFRSDVPIGFNLSGGLDSSVLLAMVNQIDQSQDKIRAFSFYTGSPEYDEIPWVEKMLKNYRNPLSKVLTTSDEIPELAEHISQIQDEPFGGIPTITYSKIFKEARKLGFIVLLDGQGMDEQWAGYDYYFKKGNQIIQGTNESPFRENVMSKELIDLSFPVTYEKPFQNEVMNKQYRDIFFTKIPRALRFNDRISMAYSTELREPFLDHNLLELAFAQPENRKIKNGIQKWMLRRIASKHLKNEISLAPKRPLQTPQREWLRSDLKNWTKKRVGILADSELKQYLDKDELFKELKLYNDGKSDNSFYIWQWINLSYFYQNLNSE